MNRARYIMSLMFLPIILLSFHIEAFLIFAKQDPQVAKWTQVYVQAYLPGMYFIGLNTCQVHFLNNLGKTKIPMISMTCAVMLHPVWSYFLVSKHQLNWGVFGTGVAGVITNLTVLTFNVVYTYNVEEIRPAVFLPDKRSFEGITEYLSLGIPSAASMALDVWAHAVFRFVSGYLGVDSLSALAILMDVMVISDMIGMGLDQASCAFVGQALGAGKVALARQFYDAFRLVSAVVILVYMVLFYHFQVQIVNIYTDIPSVQKETLKAIGLLLGNMFPDLFKGMLKGIIKALGIQKKAV